jgi:hypothetical protein
MRVFVVAHHERSSGDEDCLRPIAPSDLLHRTTGPVPSEGADHECAPTANVIAANFNRRLRLAFAIR